MDSNFNIIIFHFVSSQSSGQNLREYSASLSDLLQRATNCTSSNSDPENNFEHSHSDSDANHSDHTDSNKNSHIEPIRWKLEHKFKAVNEFDGFMKNENCWALRSRQHLKVGIKTTYRCHLVSANTTELHNSERGEIV